MASPADVPADLVPCAIAEVQADGTLVPRTRAMHAWIERVGGRLDALPLDDQQRASLMAGDKVVVVADGACQLQRVEHGGATWLVVEDVSDREMLHVVRSSSARCRSFGGLAARLAHDLNNQFNAALALAAQAMIDCRDDAEREAIRDIERGAKSGARMVSVLARMLCRPVRNRERVRPGDVVEDALAMVRKSLQVEGVDVQVQLADSLPAIRVEAVDAVHAIMNGLMALQHAGASAIDCTVGVEQMALGDGRQRSCVRLRCVGRGVDAAAAGLLKNVVTMAEGVLVEMAAELEVCDGLALAAIQQWRWGGDLRVDVAGAQAVLDYVWPAA